MNGGEVDIALTSSADGDNDAATSAISKRELFEHEGNKSCRLNNE